ncbi:transporter [Leucobacter chromiireducens]|uniref:transporter n=1 Tax=Leucobacter chromiireducens TaxID=283877 RepID=UPI00192683C8|nr:transporter [Leucobacter chromiireducens]
MAEPGLTPVSVLPPHPDAVSAARSGPVARIRVMVALRFRVLWNTLSRHPWQLVGAIIGALYGLGLLALAVTGLVALSWADPGLARTALVLGGSALVLGWMIGPILVSGMDRTLDPARLVMFPMSPGTQVAGIAVASLFGVPGIVTMLVSAATALAWLRAPGAAVVAVVLAPLAAVTCVLACQLVMTLMTRAAANRRFREIIGGLLLLLLVLAGPLLAGIGSGVTTFSEQLPGFAQVLGWTPLGAVWSVPVEVAAGNWGIAALKLLIALATVAALFFGWRGLYLANFGTFAGGSQAKGKAGTGWFGRFPATPRGAIAARSFTYWIRDPRYLQSLIVVLVMPVVFGFLAGSTEQPIMLPASTIFVAAMISLTTFTDLSYDGTAFSTHLLRGVRGIDDRIGRAWATGLVSAPLVILVAVVTSVIVGRLDQLPTLLGLAGAVLLSGLGIASVSSALFVMPVPQSGENPFVSKPGAAVLSLVGTAANFGSLFVLTLPVAALTIAAGITGDPLWVWLTFGVGLVWGAAVCWIGVRWGGTLYDRRAPGLMEKLSAQQ